MMFSFFKKDTRDLVKEWNVVYTNDVLKLTSKDREAIVQYVSDNKKEITVVLSSLTESARLKNGDKISKNLFNTILKWIHNLVWVSIITGVKSGTSFRKSYDCVFEAYKIQTENPLEALSQYKRIMGEDA